MDFSFHSTVSDLGLLFFTFSISNSFYSDLVSGFMVIFRFPPFENAVFQKGLKIYGKDFEQK